MFYFSLALSCVMLMSSFALAQLHLPTKVQKAIHYCTEVTKNGDARNRALSQSIEDEINATCVVKKPAIDVLEQFNRQIEESLNEVSPNDLWINVNEVALKKTVKSIWATHMYLIKDEKLNMWNAIQLVCRHSPKLCNNISDYQRIKEAYYDFEEMNDKKPVKFLSAKEQSRLFDSELKPLLASANRTCELTREKFGQLRSAHSCGPVTIPGTRISEKINIPKMRKMDSGECEMKLANSRKNYRFDKFETAATAVLDFDLQRIAGSKLGPLLLTENLKLKLNIRGEPSYKTCTSGKGKLFNTPKIDDIQKARVDFYSLMIQELKKIENYRTNDHSESDKKRTLKQYLKANPTTIAEVLKRTKKPENVAYVCSLIQDIQWWDQASKVTDSVLIGAGVVSGIALGFTGIGAPAGGWLIATSIGLSAVSAGKSLLEYKSQLKQDAKMRMSAATEQKKLYETLVAIKVSDERKDGALNNFTIVVASELASFGIGKAMKGLSLLSKSKSVTLLSKIAVPKNPQLVLNLLEHPEYSKILLSHGKEGREAFSKAILLLEKSGMSSSEVVSTFKTFEKDFIHIQKLKGADSDSAAYLAEYIKRKRKAGVKDSVIRQEISKVTRTCG